MIFLSVGKKPRRRQGWEVACGWNVSLTVCRFLSLSLFLCDCVWECFVLPIVGSACGRDHTHTHTHMPCQLDTFFLLLELPFPLPLCSEPLHPSARPAAILAYAWHITLNIILFAFCVLCPRAILFSYLCLLAFLSIKRQILSLWLVPRVQKKKTLPKSRANSF